MARFSPCPLLSGEGRRCLALLLKLSVVACVPAELTDTTILLWQGVCGGPAGKPLPLPQSRLRWLGSEELGENGSLWMALAVTTHEETAKGSAEGK